jgi:hypothetical protein
MTLGCRCFIPDPSEPSTGFLGLKHEDRLTAMTGPALYLCTQNKRSNPYFNKRILKWASYKERTYSRNANIVWLGNMISCFDVTIRNAKNGVFLL